MHTYASRLFSVLFCALMLGLLSPAAVAFDVADGMSLIKRPMPVNYCALTFDDGPGPYTATLLDLLAERGITATFFVLGAQAERRPYLIKRMRKEGHEVAGHTWSHPDMRRLKIDRQREELRKTAEILASLGVEARWFRPPYGRYNAITVAEAEALGMTVMLWSIDSQDWKRHISRLDDLRSISPELQRTFTGMRGVFLFHDTHKRTVADMPEMLNALVAGGCERFVTVSDYMAEAPDEEEQRLSTHAPNQGRGEMPPPPGESPLPTPPEKKPENQAAETTSPLAPPPLIRSNGAPVFLK